MDRWTAPTKRGIDRAFAAANSNRFGGQGSSDQMTARAIQGADLPTLGRIGGLGGLGSQSWGANDSMAGIVGQRFPQSGLGEPIADRFLSTDRSLSRQFDFWDTSTPGTPSPQMGQDPNAAGATGQSFGTAGNAGGSWANIDRWNPAINAAASKWGVDPNRLKAHMRIESGGEASAVQNNPTNGNTYGLMQINPAIWEQTLRNAGINMYTPEGNIEGAAFILSTLNQQYGGWDQASSAFFTGNQYWQGADSVNGNTGDWYRSTLNNYMTELQAYGGGASGTGGGNWGGIFGGAAAPISYEFGAQSVNGNMYNYGSAHGTNGMVHPALDIAVPRGTALYSPGSGTVSCVGSADAGIGGTGGGSCGYFGDTDGGGVGNITIKLDNGTFVILGHSATASVRPGQRVAAGTLMGTSGGMLGAHTHLEVRVPDPSVSSGYRVVDPRTVGLGGGGGSGQPYGQPAGQPAGQRYASTGSYLASIYR